MSGGDSDDSNVYDQRSCVPRTAARLTAAREALGSEAVLGIDYHHRLSVASRLVRGALCRPPAPQLARADLHGRDRPRVHGDPQPRVARVPGYSRHHRPDVRGTPPPQARQRPHQLVS